MKNDVTPPVKLKEGEEIIFTFRRSKAHLYFIWATSIAIIAVLVAAIVAINVVMPPPAHGLPDLTPFLSLACLIAIVAVFITAIIKTYVDRRNYMFITNKRVIKRSTISLFANSINAIDLFKVEDVSFRKDSIINHIFRFGTLRIATVGNDTAYSFPFLDTPTDEVSTISELIYKSRKTYRHSQHAHPPNQDHPEGS